jgi:Na+-transporting methylmalonyl-CoA/oxaloacetate decarboxylase gamma subunit
MGVVFAALFLLSTYMRVFKSITSRLESRGSAAPVPKPVARPAVKPVPAAGPPVERGDGQVAAAVAMGLHLAGVRLLAGGEVAAAIAAALVLHRGTRPQDEGTAPLPASGWKLAGRMEAMAARNKRHERPLGRH